MKTFKEFLKEQELQKPGKIYINPKHTKDVIGSSLCFAFTEDETSDIISALSQNKIKENYLNL